MQRVVSINLNGSVYPLEENGYNALFAYLDAIESRLKDNPDRAQRIAEIERLIAEKCQAYLEPHKTVDHDGRNRPHHFRNGTRPGQPAAPQPRSRDRAGRQPARAPEGASNAGTSAGDRAAEGGTASAQAALSDSRRRHDRRRLPGARDVLRHRRHARPRGVRAVRARHRRLGHPGLPRPDVHPAARDDHHRGRRAGPGRRRSSGPGTTGGRGTSTGGRGIGRTGPLAAINAASGASSAGSSGGRGATSAGPRAWHTDHRRRCRAR